MVLFVEMEYSSGNIHDSVQSLKTTFAAFALSIIIIMKEYITGIMCLQNDSIHGGIMVLFLTVLINIHKKMDI